MPPEPLGLVAIERGPFAGVPPHLRLSLRLWVDAQVTRRPPGVFVLNPPKPVLVPSLVARLCADLRLDPVRFFNEDGAGASLNGDTLFEVCHYLLGYNIEHRRGFAEEQAGILDSALTRAASVWKVTPASTASLCDRRRPPRASTMRPSLRTTRPATS